MSPRVKGNIFLVFAILGFFLFIYLIGNLLKGQQELVGIIQTVTGGIALLVSVVILFLEIPRVSPSEIFRAFMYYRKLQIAIVFSTVILATLAVFTSLPVSQKEPQSLSAATKVISPSSSAPQPPTPTFEPQSGVIVGQRGLIVRDIPSASIGKQFMTLHAGDKVIVTGQTRDYDNVPWYRVDIPGRFQSVWIVAYVDYQGALYIPVRLDNGAILKQPLIPYDEAKKK